MMVTPLPIILEARVRPETGRCESRGGAKKIGIMMRTYVPFDWNSS